MKISLDRTIIFFVVAIMIVMGCYGSAFAEVIRDVSIGGVQKDYVFTGKKHTISWNPVNVESPVTIALHDKNNVLVAIIAKDLNPNSPAYIWQVGTTTSGRVAPGGPYRIKVYTPITQRSTTGFSNRFKVAALPKTGSKLKPVSPKAPNIKPLPTIIFVKKPNKHSNVTTYSFPGQPTKDLVVEWNSTGDKPRHVKIFLISKDSNWSELLVRRTRNDGYEEINLKENQVKSGRYVVRVQAHNNGRLKGESEVFNIATGLPNPNAAGEALGDFYENM